MDGGVILVVDDEAAIRGLVTRWLEADGYHTIAAASAEQAIDECRFCVRVVVTDIQMPEGQDGFWLADRVHERYPDVPVVIMTGSLESALTSRAMAHGAVAFLHKPFTRDELRHIIQRLVTIDANS
jgi:CheY-like chemotaxis protein